VAAVLVIVSTRPIINRRDPIASEFQTSRDYVPSKLAVSALEDRAGAGAEAVVAEDLGVGVKEDAGERRLVQHKRAGREILGSNDVTTLDVVVGELHVARKKLVGAELVK
jgi:hypothetical protein